MLTFHGLTHLALWVSTNNSKINKLVSCGKLFQYSSIWTNAALHRKAVMFFTAEQDLQHEQGIFGVIST